VRWPGRLELIDGAARGVGRVLLDGAHNPAGARALAGALRQLGVEEMPLVFGAMRGKRVHAVLRSLAPLRPRPVFTAVDEPAARSSQELLRIWRAVTGRDGETAADPMGAVQMAAASRRQPEAPVVVAGSLYLVGGIRAWLLDEAGP
jgi:dihydrofolate synthase/folylpolyglutamate synthase